MKNLQKFKNEAELKLAEKIEPWIVYLAEEDRVVFDYTDCITIATKDTNAAFLQVCFSQGWCASEDKMTDCEAKKVTTIGDAFQYSNWCSDGRWQIGPVPTHTYDLSTLTSLDELQYFTSLTSLEGRAFNGLENLTRIILPDTITTGNYIQFDTIYIIQ